MLHSVKDIQVALKQQHFDPGIADGILGRRTLGAIRAFQIARNLEVDGIAGPKTQAMLFKEEITHETVDKVLGTPWLDMAISKKGLNENRDNEELRRFLKSDGGTVGDPAEIPWCGDFVETCIALTTRENLPGNPYLARNWLKFGQDCKPTMGAIGVFWRGQKTGINGHVAFLVGKGAGAYYILGGNQSNSVSVTSISTGRLLGARWPLSVALPKTVHLPELKGGQLSLNEA